MTAQGVRPRLETASVSKGLSFDWAMALISGWILIGLYIDGWAHNHLAETLETFFTPWHGFLYAGLFVALVFLSVSLARGIAQKRSWANALPDGYLLSWIGAVGFGAAGALDMVWHSIFGIEVTTEALLSPPHLLLAASGALIMTGSLRAAWNRAGGADRWSSWLPTLLSILWLMSVLTFFTQFAHPLRTAWASVEYRPDTDRQGWILGASGFVVQSIVMVSVILFTLRRWPSMPLGTITVLMTLNTALMSVIDDQFRFILSGVLAGITGDVILFLRRGKSGSETVTARQLGALIPFVFSLSYFVILLLGEGTWWRAPMVGGTIVISGVLGWLVSMLIYQPPVRETA